MTIKKLLSTLAKQGIELTLKGSDIDILIPKGIVISKEIVKELKDKKTEIVKHLRYKSANINSIKNIHVNENAIYPISHAQKRLWILDKLHDNSSFHNIFLSYTLRGDLNIDALKNSLNLLIKRHEILRTNFVEIDGEPKQKIHKNIDFKLNVKKISSAKNIEDFINKKVNKSFDLANDVLFEIYLIKESNKKHILFINIHHIVFDGWSVSVFIKELGEIYNNHINKKESELETLKIQYKDYSTWHNNLVDNKEIKLHKDYWLSKLGGELPILNLPTDKPRPIKQTFVGNHQSFSFDNKQTKLLKDFANTNNASLYIVLQTIIKILLNKYTNQEDIILGSINAGRDHTDLENQIGYYVNTLALRDEIKSQDSFLDVIKKVKKTTLGAFEHQVYPFNKVVEDLKIERNTSRSAVFDVMMILQNNESTNSINLNKLKVTSRRINHKTSRYDWTFEFIEENNEISCYLEYNTDLFGTTSIKRLCAHFKQLTANLLDNPEERIENIEMLTKLEKKQILQEFNNTKTKYPYDKTIIELFEKQAKKTPNNIAVVFEDTKLTYKELNDKANQLGHYLRVNYKIKKDDLVALKLERSEWMIIGILGALKSGAGYLPIDPNHPKDRIEFILKDSKAKCILVDKEEKGSKKVYIKKEEIYKREKNNLKKINNEKSIAYVIYTSGTTGKPKGVVVENRSVANLYSDLKESYKTSQKDNIVLFFEYTFDPSVEQIVNSLLNGAKLTLVSKETILDSKRFEKYLIDKKVTHLTTVPKYLENLNPKKLNKLKSLTIGGDITNINLAAKWSKILNIEYGPTEATVTSTRNVNLIKDIKRNLITIGKPISNSQIYIVNEFNQLLPVGIPGELCIGGDGITRGYLNRENLTREKFVSNPFKKGERMYKTGDLAKWTENGSIEFLGRIDFQVKIRGFRIELGEIESHLLKYSDIKEVLVIARDNSKGEKELVSYFVAKDHIDLQNIRAYLKQRVPDYMIPSYFIQLENFPLNANGKIDRKSLPEPKDEQMLRGSKYEAPKTDLEKNLVKIWEEILDIKKVGINDNFFELGGNSLKAMKLNSIVQRRLNIAIELRTLFDSPTITSIVSKINLNNQNKFKQIEKVSDNENNEYEVSHAQKRLWVLDKIDSGSYAYNIPFAYSLEGTLDINALERAFNKVIEKHESLRTYFIEVNDEPRQVINQKLKFKIKHLDLSNKNNEKELIKKHLSQLAATQFNLSKTPLIKVLLIKVSEEKHVLAIVIHHIVFDGWSGTVFINELSNFYNQFFKLKNPTLDLRIQYKDYSVWHNKLVRHKDIKLHKKYWLEKLKGELPIINLPTYRQRPSKQSFTGDILTLSFNSPLTKKLKDFANKNNISLYILLQSIIKVLLHKYTNQEDIILGSITTGRDHPDSENQIGYYVNTLVLRDEIKSEDTFMDIINKVRKTTLEGLEHQVYPFDKLVEDLKIERDMSRSAIFDVMMIMQNNEEAELNRLKNLKLKKVDVDYKISKFDMTFHFREEQSQIKCNIEYNIDLFNKDSIQRMSGHLIELSKNIIENSKGKIGIIEMITSKEKDQIISIFNDTSTKYPNDKTLIELFEAQVKKTPNNIAVIFEDKKLTYKELNEKANQLGYYLRNKYKIKPDDLIAIMLDRSEWLLIGILGILKSGAAYVPLDPTNPKDRIEYILEDSKSKLLLTQIKHINRLKEYKKSLITEDIESDLIYEIKTTQANIKHINKPTNLLYTIYTSGTTGNPKGVLLENRNMVNYVSWLKREYGINKEDSSILMTSYAFDLGYTSLYGTIFNGATLHILSENDALNPEYLVEYLHKNKITYLKTTPGLFNLLNNSSNYDKFKNDLSIRMIFLGGEPIRSHDIEIFKSTNKDVIFINHYGPTETTVGTIRKTIKDFELFKQRPVIGNPIDNANIFILDKYNNIQPIGVLGELCISGDGVARGYLNKAELTSQKFVLNSFDKNQKMYKTGDIARWLPTGDIEFLGRADFQVKIRGFRVELGEIELSLKKHNDVKECLVWAIDNTKGEKELVAYFVSKSKSQIINNLLKEHLKKNLPDYMIPNYFIQLEKFILNSNGKIDRKVLPLPKEVNLIGKSEFEKPKTEVEKRMVKVWKEILNTEKIGINDNFFELGGHSLTAIRLASLISKTFESEIKIQDIFRNNTINTLAKLVSTKIKYKKSKLNVNNYNIIEV
jgi:amino acid adenylation domain-containing protein